MPQPESELERVLDGAKLSATTRRQYKMAVRAYVRYAGNSPRNWTAESLESWLRSLQVKPQVKNVYLCAVKRAARRWASLHRTYCFADAVEGFVVPAQKRPRTPPPLDEGQLDAMLRTCTANDDPEDLRDRALLAIAVNTGFRRTELANIEFDDLDRTRHEIVVVAKRNKVVHVRVSAQCWARVEAWVGWLRRRHIGSGRLFRALRRCLDAELGWCVGPSLSPISIYRVVKRRAHKAGIRERVCTHTMRHSLVALLRKRGVPETRIAEQLGHESIETTQLYGGPIVHDVAGEDLPS